MTEEIIRTENLCKSFGKLEVLKGISTSIHRGEVVSIIGPSGGGKSTFLRCLNLLETPTSGKVYFKGTDITDKKLDICQYRRSIGMVFQNFNVFPNMSVIDNITLAPVLEKKLPEGLNVILGALVTAPLARFLAIAVDPAVNLIMGQIGGAINAAAAQSPMAMGFLLGGIMKMICTAPLSSMALTAMLGLTGLPMGIAAIACVGGSFTNGIIFHRLKLGNKGNVIAVMLEPLTQANIITANPIPIFCSNFLGGGLAGISAAVFGIVNNAPGTASPIPGLLAPFAFNNPVNVVLAMGFGILGGCAAGLLGSWVFRKRGEDGTDFAAETKAPDVQFA